MKRIEHLTGVVALALGAICSACSKSAAEGAPRTRPPPLVVVAKVTVQDVPVEVRAPIELRPIAQADVGSKTLGILDAVLVDRGDRVKRGQLVALVRPSDLPDQLSAARSALGQAQAAVTLARTNYERAKQLAPSGVVSQQELQQSVAALAQSEGAQASAQAQASALATRLGETRIESPMDGYVSARRLDPGAIVGPPGGGAIVTVVRLDTLRVFITVTEHDVTGVRLGQDAHIELDAVPGKAITGKVVRVSPTLDPSTRTLDAEVQISNPTEELRPGMAGRGAVILEVHSHALVIPVQAMQISDGKKYVFVLAGDKVIRRRIETGVDGGNWLEVTSGIGENDEVVTAGLDGLSDGAVVRPTRNVDPYSGAKVTASASSSGSPLPPRRAD